MNDGAADFRHGHPAAQRLMDEDFYYSAVEESGPFGSDDGSDTFAGFRVWRGHYPGDDPLVFLEEQFHSWGYPPFDLHVREPEIVLNYCHAHESGSTFLTGMDAAVIAVAFGQLYLEGVVVASVRDLALISLRRQMSPYLLQLWDEDYQPTRLEQLQKMLSVLHRLE